MEPAAAMAVDSRRHDLDALRAFAMLLGIALHAALSFAPMPWAVQDTRQSGLYALFFTMIHGFRMPLFFLISGYFTMLLYRRRGLVALMKQRTIRILVPCLLGLVTVIPLMDVISIAALVTAPPRVDTDRGTLAGAIRAGDRAAAMELLKRPGAAGERDAMGITPLNLAALVGDAEMVRLLLAAGADVNQRNTDGSTPLHGAAFLGRDEAARVLLEAGADPNLVNDTGSSALDSAEVDAGFAQYIVKAIGLPALEPGELSAGRASVKALLEPRTAARGNREVKRFGDAPLGRVLDGYVNWMGSDRFQVNLPGRPLHLIRSDVFHHLWFLWQLFWLAGIFGFMAVVLGRRGGAGEAGVQRDASRWMWWMVPLSFLPQLFMGLDFPSFGADTATGIIPAPHVLMYYGCFFAFGAMYYDAHDRGGALGRKWWGWLLAAGILVLFPLALVTLPNRAATSVFQVLYTWGMSVGLMGWFHRMIQSENRVIRYLSDASYWLYVMHLPLVIGMQAVVRAWPLPSFLKFVFIIVVVTGFLLIVYQACVRYTWIGWLLNGTRRREARERRGMRAVEVAGS
jgi:peptidoglycan/LPS O-acetylase OafA/YrhL